MSASVVLLLLPLPLLQQLLTVQLNMCCRLCDGGASKVCRPPHPNIFKPFLLVAVWFPVVLSP